MALDALEARSGEGGLWIGKLLYAEAGEDAEGEIEAADVEVGEGSKKPRRGVAEVGEKPEGAGTEMGCEVPGEGVELGLGEAVEEEVGDDEVGFGRGCEGECGGVEGAEAIGGGVAAIAEEEEHGGAGIDGEGVEVGLLGEESGKEAAVAVAENEGVMA